MKAELHRTIVRLAVATTGLAIIVGLAAYEAGTSAAEPASSQELRVGMPTSMPDGMPCIATTVLKNIEYINGDGTRAQPKNADASGRRYILDLAGDEIIQSVPPVGWTPLRATDQELATYGFPPRPTESQFALASWTKTFSQYREHGPVGMCSTDSEASVVHVAQADNWSGGMVINNTPNQNTFYSATVQFTQPAFDSYCQPWQQSDYATWAGLGGFNINNGQWRLLQAGTNAAANEVNMAWPFWEMVSQLHRNGMVYFNGALVGAGHYIETSTYWNSSTQSATMYVFDATSGLFWSTGQIFSYAGFPANTYYDGTTADYIAEPTAGGWYLPNNLHRLRHVVGGSTYFPYAIANGQAINVFPSWAWNTVSDNTGLQLQGTTYDGVNAWRNDWHQCT